MALGRSPPPEIRSPDAAEDGAEAEAEVEEEVFDDAFDIPHKNAPHDRLRRWRVRARSTRPSPIVLPFEFGSSAGRAGRGSGLRDACLLLGFGNGSRACRALIVCVCTENRTSNAWMLVTGVRTGVWSCHSDVRGVGILPESLPHMETRGMSFVVNKFAMEDLFCLAFH